MGKSARVGIGCMILALLAHFAAGADLDPTEWPHTAPIEAEGRPEAGLVEFALTPEVFDLSQGDLRADLRVLDRLGRETPYSISIGAPETITREVEAVKVYNRSYAPGKQSTATVDFGRRFLKNRVEIVTPGTNFRREVLIEASDDGLDWQEVREGAFLFRIAAGEDRPAYDKSTVSLPENNQRYLRLTVHNAPDDPDRVEIGAVRAWQLVRSPSETADVPVRIEGPTEDEEHDTTEIILDLGYRNLPLYEIAMRFEDADFFRRVRVSGRNYVERPVQVEMEDGGVREKLVEEPWHEIARSGVYRYSSGDELDESLTVGLNGAAYRYLRVRVENGDDAPLGFLGAGVTRLVHRVAFPPRGQGPYALYVGNPDARRADYDIAHYVDRLRREGVHPATLAAVTANPVFGKERELPWSEQYRWLIWVVLLAVVGVLAWLVIRQARALPQAGE